MKPQPIEITVLGSFAFLVAFSASGFHLNISGSAPQGVWVADTTTEDSIKRGTWVAVCPPVLPVTKAAAELRRLPYGDCPVLDVAPLLKPVRAVSGDVVRLQNGRNVTVNGVALPNTVSKSDWMAWPDGEYTVKPGEVWLLSSYSDRSFDSRYFGPVKISEIQGAARPFLTGDFR